MTTIKDLRVGDQARLLDTGARFTVVGAECFGRDRLVRFYGNTSDMMVCGVSREVEVISRADQFASGVHAAGVAFGSVMARARDEEGRLICVGNGRVDPRDLQAIADAAGVGEKFRRQLAAEERAADPMITVNFVGGRIEVKPDGSDTQAPLLIGPAPLDAATIERINAAIVASGEAIARHAQFLPPLDHAPRCPSLHCDRPVNRLESGVYFCPSCSWHGKTLTAPVVPRFGVGSWVRDIAKGTVAQVVGVCVGSPLPYTLVNVDESASVLRAESQIEACEAPR